jgi:hypothetical protein
LPESHGLDPLLDRPEAPLPGPYFNTEASVVGVHLRNQLTNTVVINPTRTDTVRFPGNQLSTTVTPRFELGYRFPDGWGGIQLGYRFLATQGSDTLTTGNGDAAQHGRFVANLVDLDYVSREFSLGPDWEMRWAIGVRAGFLYFDSRLHFLSPATDPGTVLAQAETNMLRFYGAHGLLELDRRLAVPGLALFGRMEAVGAWGRIKQTFTEDLVPAPDGSVPPFGLARHDTSVGIPMLNMQVGLSYTLPGRSHTRFLIGYQYEVWWQIGRVENSRGQLDDQGLFLRAEFNF